MKKLDNIIEIDITDDEFLKIARWAHEEDITFNQMVNKLLQAYIDEELEALKNVEKEIKSASNAHRVRSKPNTKTPTKVPKSRRVSVA